MSGEPASLASMTPVALLDHEKSVVKKYLTGLKDILDSESFVLPSKLAILETGLSVLLSVCSPSATMPAPRSPKTAKISPTSDAVYAHVFKQASKLVIAEPGLSAFSRLPTAEFPPHLGCLQTADKARAS